MPGSTGEATVSDKVCITIEQGGDGLDALMDERFGRAPRFLVVDRGSGEVLEVIDNAAASAAHGAGTAATAMMRSHGVGAVISGRFGPKALQALEALKIEAWIAPSASTARRAHELLTSGTLERAEMKVFR